MTDPGLRRQETKGGRQVPGEIAGRGRGAEQKDRLTKKTPGK